MHREGPITWSGRPGPWDKSSVLEHLFPSGPSMCFRHICDLQYPSVALRQPCISVLCLIVLFLRASLQ